MLRTIIVQKAMLEKQHQEIVLKIVLEIQQEINNCYLYEKRDDLMSLFILVYLGNFFQRLFHFLC